MNANEEFIREFLEECEENLEQLEQDLVALETEPRDSERLAKIFRTVHTIKGTSGFFGFSRLGSLTHDGESLLGRMRDGELVFSQEIATTLLEFVDVVREILASIQDSGTEGAGDYQELSAKLVRLALGAEERSVNLDAAADAGGEPDRLTDAQGPCEDAERIQEDATPQQQEVSSAHKVAAQASDHGPTTAISVESTDSPRATQAEPLSVADVEDRPTELITAPSAAEGSIRVDVGLLDELMDLTGELVLARNQLNQFRAPSEGTALANTIQRLSLITSELQEGVMQTRMQPIAATWAKFPRVIRDLAVACGKEVHYEQEGEDTELDRSLLESIRDPLTHLIRNAVDHGIELPEARQTSGKPRQGRVLLRAFHESGQVNIEITDDGRGIDVSLVKQRALERGLISADRAAVMSDHELAQLIFCPGFSTAEKVTDVSGRGVGMDVVRTNIERIGGKIDLQSRPGLGTTVRITIPLTLAIIPALIVSCDIHRFAIPQANVIELLKLSEKTEGGIVEWVHNAPVCRLRGNLLPLVYLRGVLEMEETINTDQNVNVVVLQAEGGHLGLIVDQVCHMDEIVVKPLSKVLNSIPVFAGATILGDGTVALILDVVGLARKAGMSLRETNRMQEDDDKDEPPVAMESFLLCEVGDDRRVAVRLTEVIRLEDFPANKIELASGKEVVQYDGDIMPLVRLSQVLGQPIEESAGDTLAAVVVGVQGSRAGVVVSRILDIVESPHVSEKRVDNAGLIFGSSVIDQRITDVVDMANVLRVARVDA